MPAKQCTLDLSIWAVTQRAGFTAGSMAQKTSRCRNNAPNSQTHSHFYKCLSKHPHLVFWLFVVVLKKVKFWGLAFVLCRVGVPPPAQTKVVLLWVWLEISHWIRSTCSAGSARNRPEMQGLFFPHSRNIKGWDFQIRAIRKSAHLSKFCGLHIQAPF